MVKAMTAGLLVLALGGGIAVAAHEMYGGASGVSVRRGGQSPTIGSGRYVQRASDVSGFRAVEVDDGVDITIWIASGYSARVEADDNLIDRVRLAVEGGVLRIGATGSYSAEKAPHVRLSMPSLDRLDLESSSRARIGGVEGGRLSLTSNGSGSFDADGRVDSLEVEISGSGEARLAGLRAQDASVTINGSGEADVNAARRLFAEVNGSGEINYSGGATVREAVHGNGRIRRSGS